MADNSLTVVGNVTRDANLRYTQGGQGVVDFGLAVNRRYQHGGEWKEETSFLDVVAWGTLGENVAASVQKGTRVIVTGRISQRSWEDRDGGKRSKVEVVADEIGPSLRWATCEVQKTSRTRADEGGSPARGRAPEPPAYDEEPF